MEYLLPSILFDWNNKRIIVENKKDNVIYVNFLDISQMEEIYVTSQTKAFNILKSIILIVAIIIVIITKSQINDIVIEAIPKISIIVINLVAVLLCSLLLVLGVNTRKNKITTYLNAFSNDCDQAYLKDFMIKYYQYKYSRIFPTLISGFVISILIVIAGFFLIILTPNLIGILIGFMIIDSFIALIVLIGIIYNYQLRCYKII